LRILNQAGIASKGARVLVMGVAYKKDIEDERESPAIEIIRLLQREGVNVSYHDPYIPVLNEPGLKMDSLPLTADLVSAADLVIIATGHSNIDYQWLANQARRLFDTRNATKNVTTGRERITLL